MTKFHSFAKSVRKNGEEGAESPAEKPLDSFAEERFPKGDPGFGGKAVRLNKNRDSREAKGKTGEKKAKGPADGGCLSDSRCEFQQSAEDCPEDFEGEHFLHHGCKNRKENDVSAKGDYSGGG